MYELIAAGYCHPGGGVRVQLHAHRDGPASGLPGVQGERGAAPRHLVPQQEVSSEPATWKVRNNKFITTHISII
jgi:hypothetical protein